ncbi:Crp/Fnr family transcriptional regulator [Pelagimonas sp. KU-00592-HH]|uniref:Crp/Fnr family transcriptional regulator n=1 Tax=Pelagimonas sp. KU-00592-HH TaxID=3127651 RepID=UPI00310C5D0A
MAQKVSFERGAHVFSPGQECAGFVRLETGTIRVSMTAANGREVVLYRVLPGEICLQTFSCLVDGHCYAAEGVVEQPVAGEFIPKSAFWRLMGEDEAFRRDVFSAVAQRFGDYQRLVEEVALTGFDTRLARVLLRLRDGRNVVHATHGELAAETASGRAFVSRRLAEFAHRGLVELARGQVSLLDISGVERIAEDDG